MSVELDLPDLSSVPAAGSPLLDLLRPAFGVIARNLWRTTEHHRDRIPDGRCILAVNHVGLLDGPLVVALNQDAQAMAKKELWKVKPLGHFLDAVGQVPIDRWNPDPGSIRRCIAVLQAERRLVIFPEQHRGNGDFAQFKRGTAYLAMVTGAPVVPVALIGAATNGTGIRSVQTTDWDEDGIADLRIVLTGGGSVTLLGISSLAGVISETTTTKLGLIDGGFAGHATLAADGWLVS